MADREWNGFIAIDPKTDKGFVNAVGSSPAEVGANLSLIEIDAEVEARVEIRPVRILAPGELDGETLERAAEIVDEQIGPNSMSDAIRALKGGDNG